MPKITREPTSEELTQNKYVEEFDAYALWYPSTGGYVGKCWIVFDDNDPGLNPIGGCFTAYIYHNGDFPTSDISMETHHCSWEQFVSFGNTIGDFEKQRREVKEMSPFGDVIDKCG